METEEKIETIPVTIEKSHIVTIGERLYSEAVELIRELVNNAYDADATEVYVTLSTEKIVISDNGSGMDKEGLKQYFTIGSTFKKHHRKTPKFGRERIGEFGIGKFSSLSACQKFELHTRRANFAATVIFDKSEWNKSEEHWHLPMKIETAAPNVPDGTRIILYELNKVFEPEIVERRLQESVPLKAPQFSVFLNGKKIHPRFLAGKRIPFMEGTPFGIVHGEIIIAPQSLADPQDCGIECKIRQVTIKREFFGLENLIGSDMYRISGEVHADFLQVSSDRSNFIMDLPEYLAFLEIMKRICERITKEMLALKDEKENRRVGRSLKEMINKIQDALLKNIEWCPPGFIPAEEHKKKTGAAQELAEKKTESQIQRQTQKKKRIRRPKLKQLSPSAFIKKLKIGTKGLALVMDHFGPSAPESFTESEIIYINRDHPLFIREANNRERHIMHVARLITQEIALMSNPKNPRQAFERQSKLLKDSFSDKSAHSENTTQETNAEGQKNQNIDQQEMKI
ncbi:MAG: ATP-binding protein [Elusimicrobia bacterium]|nr:ATP-binding protein [Elusimicrobiota bacterium]